MPLQYQNVDSHPTESDLAHRLTIQSMPSCNPIPAYKPQIPIQQRVVALIASQSNPTRSIRSCNPIHATPISGCSGHLKSNHQPQIPIHQRERVVAHRLIFQSMQLRYQDAPGTSSPTTNRRFPFIRERVVAPRLTIQSMQLQYQNAAGT